jgi:hypothetical protein
MALTAEHRCLALAERHSKDSTDHHSHIDAVEPEDLRPGMRVVLREGGEKDVIRLLAEQRIGAQAYAGLRQTSSLWREALRASELDAGSIARRLRAVGIRRHMVTIRYWLASDQLIGPRSDEDVLAIADAFPLQGKTERDWTKCCHAISELRGLHLSAGARLSDILADRCGGILFEPSDREIAVDLGIGTVWIIEVGEIDPEPVVVPANCANRLQWSDASWRAEVLDNRIQAETA